MKQKPPKVTGLYCPFPLLSIFYSVIWWRIIWTLSCNKSQKNMIFLQGIQHIVVVFILLLFYDPLAVTKSNCSLFCELSKNLRKRCSTNKAVINDTQKPAIKSELQQLHFWNYEVKRILAFLDAELINCIDVTLQLYSLEIRLIDSNYS